jgi:glycosyltransferase involved in cell wall biosynthesis
MVTTDLALGGAERVVINLVDCLRDMGHECAVAGLKEPASGGHARRELQARDVPVFCADMEGPWSVWRLRELRRFVHGWQPDVLHCHMFHGHAAGLLLRLSRIRTPQVWSYHTLAKQLSRWRHRFYPLARCAGDAHVYVSAAVRDSRREASGAARRERVIHNGIDLAPLLDLRPTSGRVFGMLGRLVPEIKGTDVAIRAFAQLDVPDARLRIAGRGPGRAELEALAADVAVADRVEFVGFVRRVPQFLESVNVFVNPSRWEAFGLTLVEGMAAGLPCIASRVDGLAEVGGELVQWVPPGDVDALVEAMAAALDRGPLPPDQRRRQREYVQVHFSREAMAHAYLETYRDVLQHGNAPSGD